MIKTLLFAVLISVSPLGEARAGLPYAILKGMDPIVAFIVCFSANLLVLPLVYYFMNRFDKKLWKYRRYRKVGVKISRRARSKTGAVIRRHGFWGLMLFVMIPLPVTGAYVGAISAYLFKVDRRKAFMAISLGLLISCILVATGTHLSIAGIQLI